jgi:RNA polymerase sigma factor (sigma-70 family)
MGSFSRYLVTTRADAVIEESLQVAMLNPRANVGSFEAAYVTGWSPVYRYCLALVRDPDDAEDAAAETFRRAFVAWGAGRGPVGETLPWLFVIARRIVIDHQRRNRIVGWLRLNASSRTGPSDDPIRRSELWLWFEQLCEILPDRQREALVLRYQFDLPDETIGRLMGMSPASVRTTVSRALARLRNQPEVLR